MRSIVRSLVLLLSLSAVTVVVEVSQASEAQAAKRRRPVVASVSPRTGLTTERTRVLIRGAKFKKLRYVTFGTARVRILSRAKKAITVVAPRHSAGVVAVRVVTRRGASKYTTASRFKYTAPPPHTAPPPVGGGTRDPVLVGAGDIASSGRGDSATAALLDRIPGTVFTVGDNVYEDGTTAQFNSYYAPTWGRHRARTRPAPGNHDYHVAGAPGYFNYFGTQAGPSRGYYSYDLGNWHVVSLNSEIDMAAGSPQESWLRRDLTASRKPCTLAYWHRPLFTSGNSHGPATSTRPLFAALYAHRAEVVVSGHNHEYERFAPMRPTGTRDDAGGIREFVAGTGGVGHNGFITPQPNSQIRNGTASGVLKFVLHRNSYDWQFVPVAGQSFTDHGTTSCH